MKETDIKLDDLFDLRKDLGNTKIVLNMTTNGKECVDIWLNEDERVDFSYWSHRGLWKGEGTKKPNRNLNVGNIIFGFVRLGSDRWLLITVGKITSVPEITITRPYGDYCLYDPIPKYKSLLGRLIINLHKGNKNSRYAFNMSTFINEIIVEQILPVKYGIKPFPGYESVVIGFSDLSRQIEDLEWKSKLSSISGIYLITDTSNNKKYVGSAYGQNGIYGRWRNYLDHGYDTLEVADGSKFPNTQLRDIVKNKDKGLEYIRTNFMFSILETLPSNYSNDLVITREKHWKTVLKTVNSDYGYNSN